MHNRWYSCPHPQYKFAFKFVHIVLIADEFTNGKQNLQEDNEDDSLETNTSSPIRQACLSRLIKFRDVHRLPIAAISDIVDFAKMLHHHYVTESQTAIGRLCDTNATMEQLLNCVEIDYPLAGLHSQYHLQNHMASSQFYIVS